MADTQAALAALRGLATRSDEAAAHALTSGAPDPEAVRRLGEQLEAVLAEHHDVLDGRTRTRLQHLAMQATSADQRRRPPARTFGARLRDTTPTRLRNRSGRRPALAVSMVVVAGVAVATAPGADATPGSAAVSRPTAADPATVEIDGVAYLIGDPGDVAVATPATCDDAAVLLLRPATGALYAFDHLATPDEPVSGELVGHARGAVDLAHGAACDPSPVDSIGQPVPTVTIPTTTPAEEPPT